MVCQGLWDLCLPGPTGPFGSSGPASPAIRSLPWPTCPLGPFGPSGPVSPAGPLGPTTPSGPFTPSTTTSGPWGHSGPTSPWGPSARPCLLQTDSLHSTDARCYGCKMRKDMSPFSFPGILEPSHLIGSLKSPRVDPGVPCRPLALWGPPYQCLRLVHLYQRCLHPHCLPAAPGRPWDPWCRPDRLDP